MPDSCFTEEPALVESENLKACLARIDLAEASARTLPADGPVRGVLSDGFFEDQRQSVRNASYLLTHRTSFRGFPR